MTHDCNLFIFFIFFARTIDRESKEQRRSPSLILFEEWGTSGRVRPTLGHLLQLLVRIEFYRAADYIAVEILSESPPQRPQHGPAAVIDTAIPAEVLKREIESRMDNVHYPNTESLNACIPSAACNVNRNYQNELNIDQCKVDFSTAQQTTLTQSNNNTIDEQLAQMTGEFSQLLNNSSRTATTESGNSQEQFIECEFIASDNLPHWLDHSVPHSSNGASETTQDTNLTTESSIQESTSQFIPVMIGENGLISLGAISNDEVSAQIPTMITDDWARPNQTQSTEINSNVDYASSFIPLPVINGNSSQSSYTTQSSNESNSNSTLDSSEFPSKNGENGPSSTTSTMSTEIASSSALIPLPVTNETDNNRSSEHNGTNS